MFWNKKKFSTLPISWFFSIDLLMRNYAGTLKYAYFFVNVVHIWCNCVLIIKTYTTRACKHASLYCIYAYPLSFSLSHTFFSIIIIFSLPSTFFFSLLSLSLSIVHIEVTLATTAAASPTHRHRHLLTPNSQTKIKNKKTTITILRENFFLYF